MKVDRTAKFSFSNEDFEIVRKMHNFLGEMDDQDYEDLKDVAGFDELYDNLDSLYNFMCENPE